jgi:hypothetical protein
MVHRQASGDQVDYSNAKNSIDAIKTGCSTINLEIELTKAAMSAMPRPAGRSRL